MYKKLDLCPSCKSSTFNNYLIAKDHLVTDESFAIVQCQQCQLLFTNPQPDDSRLAHYYASDQYISHNSKKISFSDLVYRIVRRITLHQKISFIKKYRSSGTLLDYGAGTGAFLQTALQSFDALGIEPSTHAIKQAPLSVQTNLLEHIDSLVSGKTFNVITLWHVLEHLPDLHNTFSKIKNRLSKKGYLFIAIPNPDSWDSQHYGSKWAGYDVPRHLCHFNQKAMSAFLKPYGLRILETKPMTFDAYYVSMLSEQHLSNPYSFIKGLYMGYLSNRSAYTSRQYSSLLYVIGA